MRVNEELENILMELEAANGENVLSLMTVVNALETTYKKINSCALENEKEFYRSYSPYVFKKTKYDVNKGKTIYQVSKYENYSEKVLFNIEVSNVGEISFDIIGEDEEEIKKQIEKINEPSARIIEQIKMNADISFFTENRELVISSKPYLAIKMGNFVEGDKAVLVYKEEANSHEVNKINTGLKYIRIDQIEGYLKNIKIDERKIPILAYAFFNKNNEEQFNLSRNLIMSYTYPYLTEEKVKEYKSYDYMAKVKKETVAWSGLLSVGLGLAATAVALTTPLPDIAMIATGFGAPIATGSMVWLRKKTNEKRAYQKEELLAEASVNLYKSLKKLANEKATQLEKEMSAKKRKKSKILNKNQPALTPKEIITEVKRLLKESSSTQNDFYKVVLSQLENAYGLTDSLKENPELLKDEILLGELYQVVEEIYNLNDTSKYEMLENTLASMQRLVNYGDSNKTIENINEYTKAFIKTSYFDSNEKLIEDRLKLYIEAFLICKEKNSELSIQTIAAIPTDTKEALVEMIQEFGHRMRYLDDKKANSVHCLMQECYRSIDDEIKIVNLVNEIYDENLSYDLLGKSVTKNHIKVKEKTIK